VLANPSLLNGPVLESRSLELTARVKAASELTDKKQRPVVRGRGQPARALFVSLETKKAHNLMKISAFSDLEDFTSFKNALVYGLKYSSIVRA
jgi:hypothetical protein